MMALEGETAYLAAPLYPVAAPTMTPYESAMAKLGPLAGVPLSPIEYVTAVLASNQQSLSSSKYTVDNSAGDWDPTQKNGPAVLVVRDDSRQVIYFAHSNYVGPQLTQSVANLGLPDEVLLRHGIAPEAASNFSLVILGAILIVAGIALAESGVGVPLIVYGSIIAAGAGIAILGAVSVAFTPTVVSTTCNTAQTSCCIDTTDPVSGTTTTCADCSSGDCSSSQQSSGGVSSFLGSIAWGLLAIGVVGVGVYVAFKVVQSRANRPRPYKPPPPGYGMGASPSTPPPGASMTYTRGV